jgi:hypothetical protein
MLLISHFAFVISALSFGVRVYNPRPGVCGQGVKKMICQIIKKLFLVFFLGKTANPVVTFGGLPGN